MDIGKTLTEDKNIVARLLKFANGLDDANKRYFFQLVARIKKAYMDENHCVGNLSLEELLYFKEIESKFYANIFEVGGVYCYNGYFLPKWQFEVGVFYDKHGLYRLSKETLRKIRDKDFIDVGGYVGDSALVFREFTDKKIYSFEATKQNYEFMLETIKLNRAEDKIVPVRKALGAKSGTMSINFDDGMSSFREKKGQYSEEVEMTTLDEFVALNGIEVGFIKVDIEGFEQEFLKGAINTIKTQKPAMLISIYHNASDFLDIKPLIESWDLGYKFFIYKPIDGSVHVETGLYCEVKDE